MKKYLLLLIAPSAFALFFGLLPTAQAAITFDVSSTISFNGFKGGPVTVTSTFTTAGANRFLCEAVHLLQDVGGTGVVSSSPTWTVGGTVQNFTKYATSSNQTTLEAEIWCLINPTKGTGVESTTITGATDAYLLGFSDFNGADQSNPVVGSSTAAGNQASTTLTITPHATGDALFTMMTKFATSTLTFSTSSLIYASKTSDVGPSISGGASFTLASTTSQTILKWTWTTAQNSVGYALDIQPTVTVPATNANSLSMAGVGTGILNVSQAQFSIAKGNACYVQ